MDSQIQDMTSMSNVSGMVNFPVKTKVKDKARKQLWESLLEVYEKEADKGSVMDVEEVDVTELEDWPVTHPTDCPRALAQLTQTNPHLVFSAFTVAGTEQLEGSNEIKLVQQGKKRKRETANSKEKQYNRSVCVTSKKNILKFKTPSKLKTASKISQTCHSKRKRKQAENKKNNSPKTSTNIKSFKRTEPLKGSNEIKLMQQGEKRKRETANSKVRQRNSSVYLMSKKNIRTVKTRGKLKPTSKISQTSYSKRKRKQVEGGKNKSTEAPKTLLDIKYFKTKPRFAKYVPPCDITHNQPTHKCNLKLRFYNNTKDLPTRHDGRVFKCKLIFKVCECSESDEMF